MLDQDLHGRAALLGVPGLVGLDRRDHVGEVDVAGLQGVGRQRHELKVGEPGLECERQLDGQVHDVWGCHHAVEQVPRRERHPVVGVEGLLGPVVLRVLGDELVTEEGRDLRVPHLVELPERGHVAPGCVQAEPRHLQLAEDRGVLDQGDAAEVHLGGGLPALVQDVEVVGPLKGGLDGVRRGYKHTIQLQHAHADPGQ